MTQNFQGFNPENCTACNHPKGSHLLPNNKCAILGCSCASYTNDPAQAAPAPEAAAPAPAPDAAAPAAAAPSPAQKILKEAKHLEAAKLGLSQQLRQLGVYMLEQFVAHEVLEFVRQVPGRQVIIKHELDGEVTIEALDPEGKPTDLGAN